MNSTRLQLTIIVVVAIAAFLSLYLRNETPLPPLKNPVDLEKIQLEPITPDPLHTLHGKN